MRLVWTSLTGGNGNEGKEDEGSKMKGVKEKGLGCAKIRGTKVGQLVDSTASSENSTHLSTPTAGLKPADPLNLLLFVLTPSLNTSPIAMTTSVNNTTNLAIK